jgi:anhydro-N-acetylmuramic acid kinase
MTQAPWAIGLMTGTVIDGMIDVAAVRTEGIDIVEFGPWSLVPYPPSLGGLLADAFKAALAWRFDGPEPAAFADVEESLTLAQVLAVQSFMIEHGLKAADVRVVGFHGQTVLHRAPSATQTGATRQLGDGEMMARLLGIDVVYDFRTADIEAGGHGAPVSASYHAALLRHIGAGPETAILNLGGVANLTWCDAQGRFIAFDTGPACGPVNDWVERNGVGDMDVDGLLARRGRVHPERLKRALSDPFFKSPYPKSLDRYDFTDTIAHGLSVEDGAATLTAFVAATVGTALELLPQRPTRIIVCGGGRKNPALMTALGEHAGVAALAAEDVGIRGDAVEAECFGFLAMRTLHGLPITFAQTTGAPQPMCGGVLARAEVAV